MPRDGNPDPDHNHARVTVPDEPCERLWMLERMLRGDMPEGFRWDFSILLTACGSTGCALVLWRIVTGREGKDGNHWFPDAAALEFGITEAQAFGIFLSGGNPMDLLTPTIIADRIARVRVEVGR